MSAEPENKSYVFRPSPDTLRAFRNTSAEDRLNWLEEARRFVEDFVPARALEKWRKISGN